MSATGTRVLALLNGYLMSEVLPGVDPAFRQASLGVAVAMLGRLGEDWDAVAERRVEENGALRHLFRDAAPAVSAPELRARLEAAAETGEASLRISELERANAALRALLIELHEHVEESDHPDAPRVEREIWDELVASTERRKLPTDPF